MDFPIDLTRLNICFIAGTLGQGGAERQLFYLLKTLRSVGASPHLLSLTQGEFWEAHIRELGVPVIWVGQTESRLSRLKRIITELRALKRDSEQRLVLQSQHFYTNIYAAAAARALNAREIGAMRCDGLSEVQAHGRLLGGLSLKLPRLIAANSQAAIRFAVDYGIPASRLFLLPNAIESDLFNSEPKEGSGELKLLTVGRLEEQKRIDRFLRLVATVKRQSAKTIRAIIAGDGSLRKQLEAQSVELGLNGTVEFRGLVNDMASLYRGADIFVLTSDWEGTPNVVLEAMAAGLPVLSTNVGGVPDIVKHGQSGLLADPQDEDLLINQLIELINNSDLRGRLGNQARIHVEENHSLKRLPFILSKLYQLALS